MPGRAGKIQHRRSLLIAPQRAIRGLPCPGFRQCVTDMLDRIPRRLTRPAQQHQERDRPLGRLKDRRGDRIGFRGIEVVEVLVNDPEHWVVVHHRVLTVGESFGIVEHGEPLPPGLMHRAQEPLPAFLDRAGDPHRMRDHRPRITSTPRRRGAHHLERGRDRLPRIKPMLDRESGVLVPRVVHQIGGDGIMHPRTLALLVQTTE